MISNRRSLDRRPSLLNQLVLRGAVDQSLSTAKQAEQQKSKLSRPFVTECQATHTCMKQHGDHAATG